MIKYLTILLALLASCSSINIEQFNDSTPKLKIEDYFLGKVTGMGIVLDRSAVPIKQFTVELTGTLDHSTQVLTLDEDFSYSDGKKEKRIWKIKINGDGRYEGQAADVIGSAKGIAKGQALNWQYVLEVPYDNSTIELDFDDWMFLQKDEKTLINKAIMSKYGIYVGEVLLFFTKHN